MFLFLANNGETVENYVQPFQWGPYILVAVGVAIAITGFFARRFIASLDQIATKLAAVETSVLVVKEGVIANLGYRVTELERKSNDHPDRR